MAPTSRRPGRPDNGERVQKTMRFPASYYHSAYLAAAAELGLDFNAYVNYVLARRHRLAPPGWAAPAPDERGDQLQLEESV
ncbi:hypothetical protein [Pseudonocardia sp. ICBG1142]|uniref:hypothetical protein n=1 Tax=Pseudonocardia sp. ICBG1142 TaxID=2846760 RepID=UPI001CF63930|nr:hypothetical protein [Pseudonocardia sp. ICBG1142]